jgi:hypothetical protein
VTGCIHEIGIEHRNLEGVKSNDAIRIAAALDAVSGHQFGATTSGCGEGGDGARIKAAPILFDATTTPRSIGAGIAQAIFAGLPK